jgi:hypothetical protein
MGYAKFLLAGRREEGIAQRYAKVSLMGEGMEGSGILRCALNDTKSEHARTANDACDLTPNPNPFPSGMWEDGAES